MAHGRSHACTSCQRLNGTFAGKDGQILNISDLRHGKISSDFTNPVFGQAGGVGLGDPAGVDSPRKLQLSFHVAFLTAHLAQPQRRASG
ncbi:MAG TPA: hypothetical protein VH724_20190, partial [Candidatus Angelobacter sp.]|nr:hypothetical protein [Candidatus Angelobacter sp.]